MMATNYDDTFSNYKDGKLKTKQNNFCENF